VLDLSAARAAAAAEEPVTKEHAPFALEVPAPAPDADEEFTQPGGQPVVPEENQAPQTQPTEQISRPQLATLLAEATPPAEQPTETPAPWGAQPSAPSEPAPAPRASRRPLILTLLAVTLLGVGVGVTWILRPGGEFFPEGPTTPSPTTVVPPAVPQPTVDAGEPEAVDAGTAAEPIDAGVAVAIAPEPTLVVDAGLAQVAPVIDAGSEEITIKDDAEWFSGDVQSRGRVKMGEVLATSSGVVSWTVAEEQRVKGKEVVGNVAREGGGESPLSAPSVGLVMIKQPTGATVKRGAVLADIIYFEAWAKGVVKSKKAPTPSWRCKVISEAAGKKADCKISVVAPKAGGFQVTVAIEPRWFDEAADAVVRVAPP